MGENSMAGYLNGPAISTNLLHFATPSLFKIQQFCLSIRLSTPTISSGGWWTGELSWKIIGIKLLDRKEVSPPFNLDNHFPSQTLLLSCASEACDSIMTL